MNCIHYESSYKGDLASRMAPCMNKTLIRKIVKANWIHFDRDLCIIQQKTFVFEVAMCWIYFQNIDLQWIQAVWWRFRSLHTIQIELKCEIVNSFGCSWCPCGTNFNIPKIIFLYLFMSLLLSSSVEHCYWRGNLQQILLWNHSTQLKWSSDQWPTKLTKPCT